MTTRSELRARIRGELNDAGPVQLWSDASLNQWMVEGLRELGRQLGLEKSVSLLSVAGHDAYSLPMDLLQVKRVEHPNGQSRVPGPESRASSSYGLGTLDSGIGTYDVWAGQVVLAPAPDKSGESIAVRYVAAYAEPTTDAGVLDIPARDEDAIVFYACRRAALWVAGDEAKRQRFERQLGSDPTHVARHYEGQYTTLVRQRRGRVATRRLVRQ